MEQEPVPFNELLLLILFLGSVTFFIGMLFQVYILYRNRKSILISITVIFMTRILTVISAYFIWAFWFLPIDNMFIFLFLPAAIAELIFSPLILKMFGNKMLKIENPA